MPGSLVSGRAGAARHEVITLGPDEVPGQAGELGDVDHPDADRLTVTPRVVLDLLDGVSERVTVVEDLAQRALAQVVGDDLSLDPDGALDELAQVRVGGAASDDRV